MRPPDLPPAEHFPHGTRARYVCGCRCDGCRRANREHANARARAIKAGDANPLVSATEAQAHLLFLSHMNVGRRAVRAVTGISRSTLVKIRNGKKTQIRRLTERKILRVTLDARLPSALVPGTSTWERIRRLRQAGFKKAHIALRLGKKGPSLHIRVNFVTAKTERDVKDLLLTELSRQYHWN